MCILCATACGRGGFDRLEEVVTPVQPFDECAYWSCNGGSTCCVPTETLSLDFEPPTYSPGLINGVAGWSSLGAAGQGCAIYDHAVVANTWGYSGFGGQSLRVSNAVTSDCYSDATSSPGVVNEAGEASAISVPPGVRQEYLEIEWQFASAVPSAEQAGLRVEMALDHGGSHMSLVQVVDNPGGLVVTFAEYVDAPPYGSVAAPADGCEPQDLLSFVDIASDLDRSLPHTVRVRFHAIDGPANDVVMVSVDGTSRYLGTSWEDLFRWCEGLGPYAVDDLALRTSNPARPLLSGYGLVIDNVMLRGGCACP
ncbi:MAG: hypothetical protein ACAI38_03850 [Myxococcota bacterium]